MAPWLSTIAAAEMSVARLLVMRPGQGPLLEQEAGDVGLSGGAEHGLEDDEQGHGEQGPRRPPYPGPEAQRDEDEERVDGEAPADEHRRHQIRFDEVEADEAQGGQEGVPRLVEGHQPAQSEQQSRGDRPQIGYVVE